jgi:GAF domain-containing protein
MIADEENNLRYVAASNETSHAMEEAQSEAGQGPCVAAFVTNHTTTIDDVRGDDRWPLIREPFVRHGIISVLGVPVRLGGVPVGSLDVFLDEPHKWDDSERAALNRYSDVVEATLGAALAAHRAGELAGQLQYALDYRIVIERAVGFLMAKQGVDPVRAFDLLRRAARSQRRKVAEVAQYLLDTGSFPRAR